MGFGGVGPALGDVAVAAGHDLVRHGHARGGFEGFDHFKDAEAAPRAEVPDVPALARGQRVECAQMALGQIDHVDVVAHARAVGRWVIVAKHL